MAATLSLPLASLSLHPQQSPCSFSRRRVSCQWRESLLPASNFFGQSLSHRPFACRPFILDTGSRVVVTRAAATPVTKKKVDSAVKRARQAEKARIYNRSRKSEITTRMKKVFVELDALKKKPEPTPEMIVPIESLISEAFSTIDKAVKVGTLHRNTGAHRKSRLSRAKKVVELQLGWYNPAPAA